MSKRVGGGPPAAATISSNRILRRASSFSVSSRMRSVMLNPVEHDLVVDSDVRALENLLEGIEQ